MPATLQGFQIPVSGMQTYQLALNTTAHNIANAQTVGYSKQTVNTKATTCGSYSSRIMGSGVTMTSITTTRNEYYDIKYRNTNSSACSYDTTSYYLKCMEDALYANDEEAASITKSFGDFFETISGLHSEPDSDTKRNQVVTYGTTFTEFVSKYANDLVDLQKEANAQIKTTVDAVNALAEQIASLTKQINTLECYNGVANDLRDQRNVLLDKLSQYVTVDVLEKEPANGVGFNQYLVYVNGGVLVDGDQFNSLVLTQREAKDNINDIESMYEINWSTGDVFPITGGMGGELDALFFIRDGNNNEALKGSLTALAPDASGKIVATLEDTNVNNTGKLNIPASNGYITLCGRDYEYESFTVDVAADGTFTYHFVLKNPMSTEQQAHINRAIADGTTSVVGSNVDFKGIPYYMGQLNEFVRVFSEEFNTIHNSGYDYYGENGLDFFNATHPANGENYVMNEAVDGMTPSFSSIAQQDAEGNWVGSYYYMTCLNVSITKEVVDDPRKIAQKEKSGNGVSEANNLEKLYDLKEKKTMFSHGEPDTFLESIVSSVGVDSAKAESLSKSQTQIRMAVESRRLSVSSVDKDEEGAELIKIQNLLFHQYKVLSVMDEVLDKLINGTAL